jgi:hypothetical protein
VEDAKKKKQEEKRLRKLARKNAPEGEDPDLAGMDLAASGEDPEQSPDDED